MRRDPRLPDLLNIVITVLSEGVQNLQEHSVGPKHRHKCRNPACGEIWEHFDLSLVVSDKVYDELHNCPKCGLNTRWKYAPERGLYGANPDESRRDSP